MKIYSLLILTITIISWNTKELLRNCLHSLLTEGVRRIAEVHVVDNNSHDGSLEMVRCEFPEVRVFANTENLGFARANNQSWREAQGKYWLLLNSDTIVKPHAIEELVAFMDAHPKAGMATAKLLNLDGTPQHCAQAKPSTVLTIIEYLRIHKLLPSNMRGRIMLGAYFSYNSPERLGWTWGTALIVRREAIEAAGALSEDFFMYGEDLEWSLRIRKHNWEIWFCPAAEVIHLGGQSTSQLWSDIKKLTVIWENSNKALELNQSKIKVKTLQLTTAALSYTEYLLRKLNKQEKNSEYFKSYSKFNWDRFKNGRSVGNK